MAETLMSQFGGFLINGDPSDTVRIWIALGY
jgi:hypothetical protein